MGYSVYYSGEIEIAPPLTEEHAEIVLAFSKHQRTEKTAPIFAVRRSQCGTRFARLLRAL